MVNLASARKHPCLFFTFIRDGIPFDFSIFADFRFQQFRKSLHFEHRIL